MENNTNNPNAEKELFLKIAAQQFDNRFEEEERRGVRDANTGRFLTHSDYGGDALLQVSFSTNAVLNKRETYLAQSPKFTDMDFITIVVPGRNDLTYHGPVTDFYQWRFPNEYKAFKNGQAAALTGTPLSLWPELQPSQIKELEFHGIRTVEQIAALSDASSGVLRGFYSMKAKAQAFLSDARDVSKNAYLQQQLAEQKASSDAEIQALHTKLEALMKLVEDKSESKAPAKAKNTDK